MEEGTEDNRCTAPEDVKEGDEDEARGEDKQEHR